MSLSRSVCVSRCLSSCVWDATSSGTKWLPKSWQYRTWRSGNAWTNQVQPSVKGNTIDDLLRERLSSKAPTAQYVYLYDIISSSEVQMQIQADSCQCKVHEVDDVAILLVCEQTAAEHISTRSVHLQSRLPSAHRSGGAIGLLYPQRTRACVESEDENDIARALVRNTHCILSSHAHRPHSRQLADGRESRMRDRLRGREEYRERSRRADLTVPPSDFLGRPHRPFCQAQAPARV